MELSSRLGLPQDTRVRTTLPEPSPVGADNPWAIAELAEHARRLGYILPGAGYGTELGYQIGSRIPKDVAEGLGGAADAVAGSIVPGYSLFRDFFSNYDSEEDIQSNVTNWLLKMLFAIIILIGILGLILPSDTKKVITETAKFALTKGKL